MSDTLHPVLRLPYKLLAVVWRWFRKSPALFQWLVYGAAIGATLMGVFVGDLGLAAMGTAIGISGVALGAVLGLLVVYLPWATARLVRKKRDE